MVDPARVAQILSQLHSLGSIRRSPGASDLTGEFDGWFDGGAFRTVTGSTTYFFADQTEALVGTTPWLSITIKFADGTHVDVIERKREIAHTSCARCGGEIDPATTHQTLDGKRYHLTCPVTWGNLL